MARYRCELIWPPFKGKAHKVVDTATGQGVGLYRTPVGAQRRAATLNAEHEAEQLAAAAAEWPRTIDGRLVWACCVSSIGQPCKHRAAVECRECGTRYAAERVPEGGRCDVGAWVCGGELVAPEAAAAAAGEHALNLAERSARFEHEHGRGEDF